MAGSRTRVRGLRRWIAAAAAIGAGCALAQDKPPAHSSALDAPLFYQLLIGEIELRSGRAGNAYEVMLDAARRSGDEGLYQRAVDIALHARAGDQALAASRAWRSAKPKSIEALRYQTQILLALNRIDEMAEPLSAWIARAPLIERPGLIAGLPRLLQRAADRKQAQALIVKVLAPYREAAETRSASHVALGRAALAVGDTEQALALARRTQADDPGASGAALLAIELLPGVAAAERIVTDYLARPDVEPAVRLAYVRVLLQSQRHAEASTQLEWLTRERPQMAEPWLTLGALHVELKQAQAAEAALLRYIELAGAEPVVAAGDRTDDEGQARVGAPGAGRDLSPAWLLLSQAAEQRGDMSAAEGWLAKVDNPQRALEVQARRAGMLARQGRIDEARALIHAAPEHSDADARAKLLAEAQLLRDARQWRESTAVLRQANQRFADDADLIYELAMAEDKLDHHDEMERLLRRVIELKPDHPQAPNALGYSLADRNQRLPEARELIRKALELAPGDPFITDSLGWVEFRLGNREEAARLLREAFRARPDTEIAAHLGEVLWTMGQHDEARGIWQRARSRDADNEVLRETLVRLQVAL